MQKGDESMNLTKEKLINLIKEEIDNIKEYVGTARETSIEMRDAIMAIVQNAKMAGLSLDDLMQNIEVEWKASEYDM